MDGGKKIEALERFSSEIENISGELKTVSEDNLKNWNGDKAQIFRAVRQFYGRRHFIIVTGMLKAGKSTLIDLLSRTPKASLVGFGVDTTLRPAVIKMSEDNPQGRIKVFYRPDGMNDKNAMQQLTDSLRLLSEYGFKHTEFPLTDEYLRRTLCCKPEESGNCLVSEPLLVVVEVPQNSGSRFFQNDCILLDMPGLDSSNSVQSRDNEKYKAFFDECDLLLFVQSSVAPVNEKAKGYLDYIGLTRDESTYSLVQNVMVAKYWQKESVTEKEQQRQTENGISVFMRCLGKENAEIKPYSVNLGMAYDGILGSQDTLKTEKSALLRQSRFTEMEEALITDIINNGKYRHIAHCCDVLKTSVQKTVANIENQLRELDSQTEQLSTEENEIFKKISTIKDSYENYRFRPVQFALSEKLKESLHKRLFEVFDNIRKSSDFKDKLTFSAEDKNAADRNIRCRPSVLNKFLEHCAETAKNAVKKFFTESYLDDFVYVENGVEKTAVQFAQEELKAKSETLKIHGISLSPDKISANVNKTGEIDERFVFKTYDGGKYESERNWWVLGLTEKKIDFQRVEKYNEIIVHYKDELERLVLNHNIAAKITSLLQSVMKEDLQGQLLESENSLSVVKEKISVLSSDKNALKETLRKLREVKIPSPDMIV